GERGGERRQPVLPRIAVDALRGGFTREDQLKVGAIGQLSELVGNIEVRIIDRIDGTVDADEDAKRFLRLLDYKERFLDARIVAQHLLLGAQHVQPAADTALKPLVGE